MNTLTVPIPTGRQAGVTLVELLVSLLLGLLLTAGMIQIFAGNRATYEFNDSLSRIQESARFTLDHISYNTRMAGYSGCLADIAIHNNLNAPDPFRDDIRNGLQGFDADGTGDGESYTAGDPTTSWTPTLPAELTDRVLDGSDVLVARSIGGNASSLVSPFNDSAQLFVSTPHDFLEGEILVVSDCQKASIFQVTNVSNTGVNIVHSNDNTYSPGNDGPLWDDDQDYGLGSEVARLQTYAFYVGIGDNGGPALFQLRLRRQNNTTSGFAPEELAEGIETMQVRYGIDNDNDGNIDLMTSADSVGDWMTVLSIEVSLLARSIDEYGSERDTSVYRLGATQFDPPNDRRLRQVFSTSVGVRNRLP